MDLFRSVFRSVRSSKVYTNLQFEIHQNIIFFNAATLCKLRGSVVLKSIKSGQKYTLVSHPINTPSDICCMFWVIMTRILRIICWYWYGKNYSKSKRSFGTPRQWGFWTEHPWSHSGPRVSGVFGPNIPEVIWDPASVRFFYFFSSHFCFEIFFLLIKKKKL